MSKLDRRERLLEKLDRDWERIFRFYRKQTVLRKKSEGKLRFNLGSQIGLDRIKLSIPIECFSVDSGIDIRVVSIKEGAYSLKTGIHQNNWYSQLDINLPKALHRNNLLNVRDRLEVIRALEGVARDLRSHGIMVDIFKGKPAYLEINRTFELPMDFTRYHDAIGILLAEKHNILRKRFHPTTVYSNPFSGFRTGKSNKQLKIYDKCYEQLCHTFMDDPDFLELPKGELVKIARKYTTLARVEFMVRKQPLQRILGETETVEDLLTNLEKILDTIYFDLLSEAGLTEEAFETAKERKVKSLVRVFKQFIRMHPHNFISALIKYRQLHLWGIDQGREVFKSIGGEKQVIYDRTRIFEKEFMLIKDVENRNPEYLKRMEEVVSEINKKV
ncbi:hypothetical protein PM10SUCC1_02520 [Propionigenium maris DSM 9537]|uniref:Uncharacterized protein n=1 Tax=Propionigenium maris DSM 9537 TaxID=1123000 RepID=A0A9W6LLJ5_9FUSO|nr:hypothetical protein [Propionigenium maris]GLI54737.1 hypothetical protein PM10SUCC1_02520 [Propionigenium maris DSM 9537]